MTDLPVPETQDQADHLMTQNQIRMVSGVLKGMNLERFIYRLQRADTLGPVIDPTLYRDALHSGKLELVLKTAEALYEAQRKIAQAEAAYAALKGKTEEVAVPQNSEPEEAP